MMSEPVHDKYWALKQMDEGHSVRHVGWVKYSYGYYIPNSSIEIIVRADPSERFELYEEPIEYFDIKEAVKRAKKREDLYDDNKVIICINDECKIRLYNCYQDYIVYEWLSEKGDWIDSYKAWNPGAFESAILSEKWHEVQE